MTIIKGKNKEEILFRLLTELSNTCSRQECKQILNDFVENRYGPTEVVGFTYKSGLEIK